MQIKFVYASTHLFLSSDAFLHHIGLSTARQRLFLSSSTNDDDNQDWRAFRAKLVQNGLSNEGVVEISTRKKSRYAHTTPFVEAGSILISIPTTDLCQAIDQQYWHRSVAIVTRISDNVVAGSKEDEVPDEQLANGANRGRWSYRGLLLNRPTNLMLGESDGDHIATPIQLSDCANTDSDPWRVQRGGDLLGLESASGTRFVCLHNLGTSDENVASVSTNIVGNLCLTTIEDAKRLCKVYSDKYSSSNFMTFGGFISWRPGQLEREMGDERNEWLVLSVDGDSIWDELQNQETELVRYMNNQNHTKSNYSGKMVDICTLMWRNYLAMVNMPESEATKNIPPGQLNFYDQMLKVWAEEYMNKSLLTQALPEVANDSSKQIMRGALVRAKCPATNDVMLYDAEFHRSLILVLEETPESTIGIILNLPMSAAVECIEGEDALPLRYGGPIDVMSWRDGSYRDVDSSEGAEDIKNDNHNDEKVYEEFFNYQNSEKSEDNIEIFDDEVDDEGKDYNDDSSFIWIHRNKNFPGSRLGESGLWMINEDDALMALQAGELDLEDVMIFAGVCIWEKGADLGQCNGGIREQIDSLGSLEIVHENNILLRVWDILTKKQDILTKDTLDINIKSAVQAWDACPHKQIEASENSSKTKLADAALKAWVAINLLEEPVDTEVVIAANNDNS